MKIISVLSWMSFVVITGAALSGQADWTDFSSRDFSVKAPPSDNSPAFKADMIQILQLQAQRTPSQCQTSAKQPSPEFFSLFRDSGLPMTELKRVAPLVARVGKLTEKIADDYKDKFHRRRPYDENSQIQPCIPKPGGSKSYPSSHAAVAWSEACVLAEIESRQAQHIKEYGAFLGQLRVIVGVHHPSDVAAGQDLGERICRKLLQDRSFQLELEKYK